MLTGTIGASALCALFLKRREATADLHENDEDVFNSI